MSLEYDREDARALARGSKSPELLYLAAFWGVLGFVAVMAKALWQLTPIALEPLRDHSMTTLQIGLYAGWVVFMAYSEGYKGFQRQLAPRMAARSLYLARYPRPLWVLLAPAFCMGLFHATRRRLIVSWVILIGVVILVIAVRQLAQPWRGMVDGGVVVGLTWGTIAVLWYFILALTGRVPAISLDVPERLDAPQGSAGRS
jgi:hypothetical protein